MTSVVSYLPTADRRCGDCGCTRAVPDSVARRDPALVAIATRDCQDCGLRVEVDTAILESVKSDASCSDCGAVGPLALAEVELPEGQGIGHIELCDDCIAQYDEGERAWVG